MSTELEYLTLDARVEHTLAGIGIAEGEGTINPELAKDVRACITKLHDALNLAELHNELCEQEHHRTGEDAARRIMGDGMPEMEVVCAECGAGMVLRESKFGKFFGCSTFPKCSATHGAHPDGKPLGVPGDAATKAARIAAHAEFDTLFASRRKRYAWLASFDTLPDHIGEMTEEQCHRLIAFVHRERSRGEA